MIGPLLRPPKELSGAVETIPWIARAHLVSNRCNISKDLLVGYVANYCPQVSPVRQTTGVRTRTSNPMNCVATPFALDFEDIRSAWLMHARRILEESVALSTVAWYLSNNHIVGKSIVYADAVREYPRGWDTDLSFISMDSVSYWLYA